MICAHPGCERVLSRKTRGAHCKHHMLTPEWHAKMAEARRRVPSKPHSAATRAAISAGVKRAYGIRPGLKLRVLAMLSERERADYDVLRRYGHKRAEALVAIGRADLVPHA